MGDLMGSAYAELRRQKKVEKEMLVEEAMRLIDAEVEDFSNVRQVVDRMIAAGYRNKED